MTLQRLQGSDKALLLDVLRTLPSDLVEVATQRDTSTLYRASQPNNKQGLHLSVAAGLDAALIVHQYAPVFLPWAERHRDGVVIRLGGPRAHDPIDPLHRLSELVVGIGNVADELRASVSTTGLGGERIVEREADRVRAAIAETRAALDKLERDVAHHSCVEPAPSSRPLRAIG